MVGASARPGRTANRQVFFHSFIPLFFVANLTRYRARDVSTWTVVELGSESRYSDRMFFPPLSHLLLKADGVGVHQNSRCVGDEAENEDPVKIPLVLHADEKK